MRLQANDHAPVGGKRLTLGFGHEHGEHDAGIDVQRIALFQDEAAVFVPCLRDSAFGQRCVRRYGDLFVRRQCEFSIGFGRAGGGVSRHPGAGDVASVLAGLDEQPLTGLGQDLHQRLEFESCDFHVVGGRAEPEAQASRRSDPADPAFVLGQKRLRRHRLQLVRQAHTEAVAVGQSQRVLEVGDDARPVGDGPLLVAVVDGRGPAEEQQRQDRLVLRIGVPVRDFGVGGLHPAEIVGRFPAPGRIGGVGFGDEDGQMAKAEGDGGHEIPIGAEFVAQVLVARLLLPQVGGDHGRVVGAVYVCSEMPSHSLSASSLSVSQKY
ncbi:MAG: hypothetical protein R2854_05115 [Caldilineaceae bacterium]